MVHGGMYNVKYRQPGTLYEPIIFEPLKQIRLSHTLLMEVLILFRSIYKLNRIQFFSKTDIFIRWRQGFIMPTTWPPYWPSFVTAAQSPSKE